MLGTLLVAGCSGERDGAVADRAEPTGALPSQGPRGGGRIIDLAGALQPAERATLGRSLSQAEPARRRQVVVVILVADQAQSLEQVGWAVGGGGANRPILLLVDPTKRQVRLEGDLPVEAKAAVAAAMQTDLARGQVATAVERGLARLGQVTP